MRENIKRRAMFVIGLAIIIAVFVSPVSQEKLKPGEPQMTVEDYSPLSTLVADENLVPSAKFPVIDVHSHHRSGFS